MASGRVVQLPLSSLFPLGLGPGQRRIRVAVAVRHHVRLRLAGPRLVPLGLPGRGEFARGGGGLLLPRRLQLRPLILVTNFAQVWLPVTGREKRDTNGAGRKPGVKYLFP